MNRWDEIQATARDVASNIHSDPDKVTAMADDLIKLVGLMVDAVGKGVAIDGESNISDPDDESAHARYLTGEAVQRYAQEAVAEASSPGCDLERWTRPSPTGYVFPEGTGWTYTDRRPEELKSARPVWLPSTGTAGRLTSAANQAADAVSASTEHGPARGERPLFAPGAEAYYRKVLGLDRPDVTASTEYVPARLDLIPQVESVSEAPHTWVTAMDDHGFLMDWQHCGVCGVRKCDGGCGDPSVGATPDIDCTTHGDDQAQQCVERCVGCGDPVGNGRAHGPNQGFGGCC